MTPTPIPIPANVNDIPWWDIVLRYLVTFALPIIIAWIAAVLDKGKKPADNGKPASSPAPTLPIKEQAEAVSGYAETLATMAEQYNTLQARLTLAYKEINQVREESYKQVEQLRSEFEQEKRRMLARNAALDKRVRYLHNGVDILILQLKGHNIVPAWQNGQKFDLSSGGEENADI